MHDYIMAEVNELQDIDLDGPHIPQSLILGLIISTEVSYPSPWVV